MLRKMLLAVPMSMLFVGMAIATPVAMAGQWLGTQVAIRSPPGDKGEMGAVNIGGTLMMGIAMVFLAVGFIMFPIVTDATDALLAYEYTDNVSITDATFTGFTAVVGITPLLVLLGFLSAAVFAMFLGVKISKGAGGTSLNLGSIIMLGLSIVFIAVGLIIMPVTLDGIASVIHGGGSGISSTYTGLSAILLVTPLLVLISFIGGAIVSGFFGIKKLGSGG